jgi:hypothetical protein
MESLMDNKAIFSRSQSYLSCTEILQGYSAAFM